MGAASRRKRLRRSLKLSQSRQGDTGRLSQCPVLEKAEGNGRGSVDGETSKLSQCLIQIAEPYLRGEVNVDEYYKELKLASAAWNLSLSPPDSREKSIMESLDRHALGEHDYQLIAQHLRDLVERKERLFPGDRRLIAGVDVLNEGDSLRVLVTSQI